MQLKTKLKLIGIICQKIKDARRGKPKYTFYDEGDKGTKEIMTKYLQGENANIDLKAKKAKRVRQVRKNPQKMFRLSDAEGTLTMTEVKFAKESLDTNDSFLIDNGKMIYIWCGLKASRDEKRFGLPYAKKYRESLGEDIFCPIVLINEGSNKFSIDKAFE